MNPVPPFISRACAILLAAFVVRPMALGGPVDSRGLEIPVPGRVFQFPRDHGGHPEFPLEWWYVTGHVQSDDGARFGFEATFFRQSLRAPGTNGPGPAALHLAHMAWLDVGAGSFGVQTRLNREGWDASAATRGLAVRNGNWSLVDAGPDGIRLQGSVRADTQWDLVLKPSKPLVRFGDHGYSRKAAETNAASYYLSWTRLAAEGSVAAGGRTRRIRGKAWMDHEISSGRLGAGQVGWDWACVQLNDGREAMAYRMRTREGRTDPYSTFTWIDHVGGTQTIGADHFGWTPLRWWTSPATKARYPTTVQIGVDLPGAAADLRLEPLYEGQEVLDPVSGVAYWEGACRVVDARGAVIGNAYLELTGYAESLAHQMK
jgi:predicted secreted hydrolase